MEAVLEPLIHSPKLYLYLQQLESIFEEEEKKRQRFYADIHEDLKAEFINGEIIVHSPVKLEHNLASSRLFNLLHNYVTIHQLGFVGYEKLLIAMTRNDYEPDVCFFSKEESSHFTRKQTKFPAPDFIAEVLSPATEERDRGVKFEDYAAHGVREYWIIDPDAETIEQYILEDHEYTLLFKVHDGTLASQTIQGFVIPVRAIFDEHENLQSLQAFLQS